MNSLLIAGSKQEAALMPETYDQWANIPGIYDVALVRNYYLYNCTNYEDVSIIDFYNEIQVIYKGEQPKLEEFGPYYYREYDSLTDVTYNT